MIYILTCVTLDVSSKKLSLDQIVFASTELFLLFHVTLVWSHYGVISCYKQYTSLIKKLPTITTQKGFYLQLQHFIQFNLFPSPCWTFKLSTKSLRRYVIVTDVMSSNTLSDWRVSCVVKCHVWPCKGLFCIIVMSDPNQDVDTNADTGSELSVLFQAEFGTQVAKREGKVKKTDPCLKEFP